MTQYPPMQPPTQSPYGSPGMPMRRGMSGAAITSLICGLVGCFLITPLLAIVFGLVGISATKDGQRSGRGLAIAGLILGILWIGGYLLMGGGLYSFYVASKPVAQLAQQFTSDLAAGNVSAAMGKCESSVSSSELQTISSSMQTLGSLQDLMIPARVAQTINGETTWELHGSARFSGGLKQATFKLRKQSDGSYKITSCEFK